MHTLTYIGLKKIGRRVPCIRTTKRFNSNLSPPEYCLELIRKYDYENFICTILLKSKSRSVAVAVRSFNVEVARVAEQVSQKDIGLMRLKFWEEVIEKCYSNDIKQVPRHPVAVELFKAITHANITRRYLCNLVSARQDNISAFSKFKTLEDIEKYAEKSVSSSYYLILEGCGVKNINADHAASHLGKAQGIVQQLRCIPYAKKLNLITVPDEILFKNRLSEDSLIKGKDLKKLSDCVYEIATIAHQHLQKSRSLMEKVPKEGRIALLPAQSVSMYLDRLQASDYNVLDPHLQRRSWVLLPRVYFNMLKNRY
ncbi:NADH dehydrogenase (ubiquinone) complex I, assembly factor 6-like isoform X6 [Anthonomus grandis grandis]|uniref:NADH dehydrogenase (ubiquinone) complex I, assembly factor 6-like isoform X6 n=1 Tax=Anthonomus grandis grandis TaxID=2921223 RepID=UPI0021654CA9|nr:NADH dehydrogenase (ubiquinone) complex I, assembly factor 6-like isoform X6 [Anthonomus grandis grandis]